MFFTFFPHQPVANVYGLVLALGVSIAGGGLFHHWVESRPLTGRMRLLAPAGISTKTPRNPHE